MRRRPIALLKKQRHCGVNKMGEKKKTVVHRKAYERKSYSFIRDGKRIRVPAEYVHSTEYKEPWKHIEPAVKIHIKHPGELESEGYHIDEDVDSRHRALAEAVKADGYAAISRALVNLEVWNKRLHPAISRIARADHLWLNQTYRE